MAITDVLSALHPPPPGDILWYKAHGLIMYFSFGVIYPLGVFGVKYARYHVKFRRWFQCHWIMQTCGVSFSAIAVSIALRCFEGKQKTTHGCIGYGISCFLIFQPLLAAFRPQPGCDWRRCWEITHWFLGTALVVFGWINIFKGLDLYACVWPEVGSQILLTWLFSLQITIIAFAFLWFDRCHMDIPERPDDDDPCLVPLMTNTGGSSKGKQFLTKV